MFSLLGVTGRNVKIFPFINVTFLIANSTHPDEMPCSVAFYLGLSRVYVVF